MNEISDNMSKKSSSGDARYMRKAIMLAAKGLPHVYPNPPVGAVAVKNGKIIGTGYHHAFGKAHAEADLIQKATKAGKLNQLKGADLYVSLEPCSHHGKTPPCTDAVIEAGFSKLFYAVEDPHEVNRGRGPRKMKRSGIIVEAGLLEDEARIFLAPFMKWITKRIPLVTAKWAMTLDGRIATSSGHSQWVSGAESLAHTRAQRSMSDAILIGSGTLHADNPLLTSRPDHLANPHRVVLDSSLSIKLSQQLVKTAQLSPVTVFCSKDSLLNQAKKAAQLEAAGVAVVGCRLKSGRISLSQLLKHLGNLGISNLLVEGGPEVLGSFMDQKLVDQVQIILAPKICGGDKSYSAVGGKGVQQMSKAWPLENLKWEPFGKDLICEAAISEHGRGRVE